MSIPTSLRILLAIAFLATLAESFAANGGSITKHTLSSPISSSLPAIANPFRTEGKEKSGSRAKVLHIESIQEYKEKVVDETTCITVVRFYSRFCRSCKASEPVFYKLASDFAQHGVKFVEVPLTKDTKVLHEALGVPSLPWTHIYHPDAGLVKFVEVPLTKDTKVLHEALGVPSLPWTHIYHPDAGLVEERKVSRKFINEVRSSLRCYVYGECDLAEAPADCMTVYGECAIDDDEGGAIGV